jgi:hypothetical protein
MHHQFANQELARLRHAEAIRSATRHVLPLDDALVPVREPRASAIRGRVRVAVGNLFAQVPTARPSLP